MNHSRYNPLDEDWDFLIILDACRYDYFKEIYRDYLPAGKFEKVLSPASHTDEWVKKVFSDIYDDIVYISANPFINSKGIKGFNPKKFFKVIDVWYDGWDENCNTVPPDKVNEATLNAVRKYINKRFIIHYMQPHAPYLSLRDLGGGDISADRSCRVVGKKIEKIHPKIRDILDYLYIKQDNLLKRRGIAWKFAQSLGLPPLDPMDAALRVAGQDGLKQAYKENLREVLKCINLLLQTISGKIIIIADHGELLGEGGDYSHRMGYHVPLLIEVPKLELNIKPESKSRRIISKNIQKLKSEDKI